MADLKLPGRVSHAK